MNSSIYFSFSETRSTRKQRKIRKRRDKRYIVYSIACRYKQLEYSQRMKRIKQIRYYLNQTNL